MTDVPLLHSSPFCSTQETVIMIRSATVFLIKRIGKLNHKGSRLVDTDMTPKWRSTLASVKRKLKHRKETDENNIRMKYVNGVSTIAAKTTPLNLGSFSSWHYF